MAKASPQSDASGRAAVHAAAREHAYDDYLAAILAPLPVREDLVTLTAFYGEIAQIPLRVSEPALGEIRLQWWRDALFSTDPTGNPVADAVQGLAARVKLPPGLLFSPLEARAAEVYPEPFPDEAAFRAYLDAAEGAALKARAHVLAAGTPAANAAAGRLAEAAAVLSLTRFSVRLPQLLARGRCPLNVGDLGPTTALGADWKTLQPEIHKAVGARVAEAARRLAVLKPELSRISRDERMGLAPIALAGPYLRVLQGAGHDLTRDIAGLSPLKRVTRLWLAARFGRF